MKQLAIKLLIPALILGGMFTLISMNTTKVEAPVEELGSVTGKITYEGSAPKLNPIPLKRYPECRKYAPIYDESLVLGDGNTLANVFIQIKNAPALRRPEPTTPVVMEIKGCQFSPRVVGVKIGQPVNFKNSDGILHNVHGLPKVNKEFNIGMPPTLKETTQTFNKPESVFPVKCDVHPWMTSYVAVMTHPYFAVTGDDGKFSIGNLPDGAYEIEAWHEQLGKITKNIVVQRGTANVDISFSRPVRD